MKFRKEILRASTLLMMVLSLCHLIIVCDAVFAQSSVRWYNPTTWGLLTERCTTKYIVSNVTKLELDLNNRLHGQHLVKSVVIKAIKGHVQAKDYKKALVLAFHGRTGGGKNFVGRMIAESLFTEGMDSNFVHLFIPELDFPHQDNFKKYSDQLKSWIHGNVSKCATQLFIFDEMQSLLPGLIDVIMPYIDYHTIVNNVDYRRCIFLLLSSSSGNEIYNITYESFKEGRKRENISLKDMEDVIQKSTFNDNGTGLWHSKMIKQHLISHFVPFLPLERTHVKKCIQDEMKARDMPSSKETEDAVLSYLTFLPKDDPIYSVKGCKAVHEKLNLVQY